MMIIKCENCGFVFWKGRVRSIDEVLNNFYYGSEGSPRCPRCLKKCRVHKILFIPKKNLSQPLVIDMSKYG